MINFKTTILISLLVQQPQMMQYILRLTVNHKRPQNKYNTKIEVGEKNCSPIPNFNILSSMFKNEIAQLYIFMYDSSKQMEGNEYLLCDRTKCSYIQISF